MEKYRLPDGKILTLAPGITPDIIKKWYPSEEIITIAPKPKINKKRGRKPKDRTVGEVVKAYPEQMKGVNKWATTWGIPAQDVLEIGVSEFNSKREQK